MPKKFKRLWAIHKIGDDGQPYQGHKVGDWSPNKKKVYAECRGLNRKKKKFLVARLIA